MAGKETGFIRGASWVKVYHAYFQSMVVEGLTQLAYDAMGPDTGFAAVARIIEKGAMKGFGVLLEEAKKAGIELQGIGLRELLEYEVTCHRKAIEEMGVDFQFFEKVVPLENGEGYALETGHCKYQELAKKNPTVCGVCVGLVTGILKRFGISAQWVSHPRRKSQLCLRGEKPEYIVYRDPGVEFPRCRIVVEKLKC